MPIKHDRPPRVRCASMRSVTPFDATGTCRPRYETVLRGDPWRARSERSNAQEGRTHHPRRDARVEGEHIAVTGLFGFFAGISQSPDSRRRLHNGNTVSDVQAPPLLVHASVMHPAQRNQVLELGRPAIRPVNDVVAIRPRRWSIAARESAALIAKNQCGANGRGDGARGPSHRERHRGRDGHPGCISAAAPAPASGAATVTTVRTASQAIRRAVSGWIGPTPPNSAGCTSGGADRHGLASRALHAACVCAASPRSP